jgi:hypothetical protein
MTVLTNLPIIWESICKRQAGLESPFGKKNKSRLEEMGLGRRK